MYQLYTWNKSLSIYWYYFLLIAFILYEQLLYYESLDIKHGYDLKIWESQMYKFFEGILIRSNVGNLYIVWLHLKKGNSYTRDFKWQKCPNLSFLIVIGLKRWMELSEFIFILFICNNSGCKRIELLISLFGICSTWLNLIRTRLDY
jgi:hypothetical protein